MVSLELTPPSNDLCHAGHWASAHLSDSSSFQRSQGSFHRTGGLYRPQPVLSIVSHASMALCRSIRLRVIGSGGLGGTHGVRPPKFGLLAPG
jgi:hypothetical protein